MVYNLKICSSLAKVGQGQVTNNRSFSDRWGILNLFKRFLLF